MRIVVLICAALVLSGCADGDWERLTTYGSGDHMRTASLPPEPAPPTAAPAPIAVQSMAQPEELAQPQPVAQSAPVTEAPRSVAGLQPAQQAYAPPSESPVREPARALSGARMTAMTAHCKGVARQRATDGGYMGYDEDLQAKVFSGTYANCMDWETTHTY